VFLVLLVILIAGCTTEQIIPEEEKEKSTPETGVEQEQESGGEIMGNVLFIIAQNNFRDEELQKPKDILEKAGYEVKVASITTNTATGMLGARVTPDLRVKDAKVEDYDLIVVVGGSGSPELAKHEEVLFLLREASSENKKLGAICLGPMVLAKAGVLEGKRATVYRTTESVNALEQGGASFVDDTVVVEEDLVTANGPSASEVFGNELLKLLQK